MVVLKPSNFADIRFIWGADIKFIWGADIRFIWGAAPYTELAHPPINPRRTQLLPDFAIWLLTQSRLWGGKDCWLSASFSWWGRFYVASFWIARNLVFTPGKVTDNYSQNRFHKYIHKPLETSRVFHVWCWYSPARGFLKLGKTKVEQSSSAISSASGSGDPESEYFDSLEF